MGRNPRTGESVFVEAKRLPFFKTGKALRERLNGEDVSEGAEDSYEDEATPSGNFGGGSDNSSGGFGGF